MMVYYFYQKEWKLKKLKKACSYLNDKAEYVIHIRNLKQALNLNRALVSKKVHKVIKTN